LIPQFTQFDLPNSSKSVSGSSILEFLISNLGFQIDSINGFLIQILEFQFPKFCFWTKFKFLISISKAAQM
jgi:hypothetical protein